MILVAVRAEYCLIGFCALRSQGRTRPELSNDRVCIDHHVRQAAGIRSG